MIDLASLAHDLISSADRKHPHLRPIAKQIASNLKIMASDDTKTIASQREAARVQLIENVQRYERKRASFTTTER